MYNGQKQVLGTDDTRPPRVLITEKGKVEVTVKRHTTTRDNLSRCRVYTQLGFLSSPSSSSSSVAALPPPPPGTAAFVLCRVDDVLSNCNRFLAAALTGRCACRASWYCCSTSPVNAPASPSSSASSNAPAWPGPVPYSRHGINTVRDLHSLLGRASSQ